MTIFSLFSTQAGNIKANKSLVYDEDVCLGLKFEEWAAQREYEGEFKNRQISPLSNQVVTRAAREAQNLFLAMKNKISLSGCIIRDVTGAPRVAKSSVADDRVREEPSPGAVSAGQQQQEQGQHQEQQQQQQQQQQQRQLTWSEMEAKGVLTQVIEGVCIDVIKENGDGRGSDGGDSEPLVVAPGTDHTVFVRIVNRGQRCQKLKKVNLSRKAPVRFEVDYPNLELQPNGGTLSVTFRCRPLQAGTFKTLAVFDFDEFKMYRKISVLCGDQEVQNLLKASAPYTPIAGANRHDPFRSATKVVSTVKPSNGGANASMRNVQRVSYDPEKDAYGVNVGSEGMNVRISLDQDKSQTTRELPSSQGGGVSLPARRVEPSTAAGVAAAKGYENNVSARRDDQPTSSVLQSDVDVRRAVNSIEKRLRESIIDILCTYGGRCDVATLGQEIRPLSKPVPFKLTEFLLNFPEAFAVGTPINGQRVISLVATTSAQKSSNVKNTRARDAMVEAASEVAAKINARIESRNTAPLRQDVVPRQSSGVPAALVPKIGERELIELEPYELSEDVRLLSEEETCKWIAIAKVLMGKNWDAPAYSALFEVSSPNRPSRARIHVQSTIPEHRFGRSVDWRREILCATNHNYTITCASSDICSKPSMKS